MKKVLSVAQRRQVRIARLQAQSGRPSHDQEPPSGPGTELRKLLGKLGIQPMGQDCKCNAHAREMDRRGVEWCAANVSGIVDWLEAEAKKRPIAGLFFSRLLAGQMVRLAIRRARKAAKI